MSILNAKHFHDEQAAYDFVEARVWPVGRVCPHCGVVDDSGKLGGKSTRLGVYKCYACRKPFTVKVGTIFESSHVALHIWLQAMHLICSSKKGISSNQLHRTLGVTLKTAWFMTHRIREAMRKGSLAPMGGVGKSMEVDETYIGVKKGKRVQRGSGHKHAVLSLVERGGEVRSFKMNGLKVRDVMPIIKKNIDKETSISTDESQIYNELRWEFANHSTVNHGVKEWVKRGQSDVHTNTIEGFFSIFKRGMKGVYQHCGEKHLHRYLAEFDFRYNHRASLGVNDTQRTDKAIAGVVGKRLTYRAADRGM